ncbi:hypothetical protein PRIPAC_73956 [Pristionchus pacificus]|uniref:Uncharacterized protein n=1 Tax=Pristionchus pacificus TaxID=54126 RepID=A0A2A6B541_PRIPA|nr:hypothetical protein PRIPAC_73956 [Pristionchus pacificus]|eukprot:PDM60992.1 hypothetical protein PRIPAC_54798 [Pristionchus pacificus]
MNSSVHVGLLFLALATLGTAAPRVVESYVVEPDEDTVYIPDNEQDAPPFQPCRSPTSMMQMAYNQTIPVEALQACERQQAAACPSPSEDGSYLCVALADLCDRRKQCPGGEDESHVMCFFFELYSIELSRLREVAKKLQKKVDDPEYRGATDRFRF